MDSSYVPLSKSDEKLRAEKNITEDPPAPGLMVAFISLMKKKMLKYNKQPSYCACLLLIWNIKRLLVAVMVERVVAAQSCEGS